MHSYYLALFFFCTVTEEELHKQIEKKERGRGKKQYNSINLLKRAGRLATFYNHFSFLVEFNRPLFKNIQR